MNYEVVDIGLFVIANFINLAVALLLIARARGMVKFERDLGYAVVAMILPVTLAIGFNIAAARELWTIICPSLLLLFLLVELLFDYILKLEFRYTRLLGPYLLTYYVGLMAMIGYSFGIGELFGFVTLATYFINLAATGYSYSRVKHG
jgi:hypothetical protein